MKSLYLLRHAESEWTSSSGRDHDRPLSVAGRDSAARIGRYLAHLDEVPNRVVTSPARRTRETLEALLPHLPGPPKLVVEERIYLASSGQLLARLQEVDDGQTGVLLIGHNPGIAELAQALPGSGERASSRRLAARFPTGATAVSEFDLERWRDLAPGSGRLLSYATPKDLV